MTGARVDVHQHVIPPFHRELPAEAGIAEAGGRALPGWSPGAALERTDLLDTATALPAGPAAAAPGRAARLVFTLVQP